MMNALQREQNWPQRDWTGGCWGVPRMSQGSPRQDWPTHLWLNNSSQLKCAIFLKAGCFPSLFDKCFTGKVSLSEVGMLVKNRRGEFFFPLCFWDSLIPHASLVKKDYKSIQALWKVADNGISTSDCYETQCSGKTLFLWSYKGYFCKEKTRKFCGINKLKKKI